MKIIHFGYSLPIVMQPLFEIMQQENVLLTDIRFSTKSVKKPYWSQSYLHSRFGKKYIHVHSLGNQNFSFEHRSKGIKIVNLEKGLSILSNILEEEKTPILMCTCINYETCHRKVVIDAILKKYPELQVEALC